MTWQRQVGKLGDARRIADQLVALAERLTRSYPDQAAAFMLLSEGYVQEAKIAYRVDGEPVIGWERKALDAAIHAEKLEPEMTRRTASSKIATPDWPSWHRTENHGLGSGSLGRFLG